jgi:DNA-binding HxlR family transcriptional regulator
VAKRSYHQYCGLAMALDVVAERWALLIVRDLAPGPRRFNDLFAGLPGIATDMLAERLRSLEAAGAITQRQLRDPVPANVYELTNRGRELADIMGSLAVWGLPMLPKPQDGEFRMSARWAMQSMSYRYRGAVDDCAVHWTIAESELTLTITGDRAVVRYGHHGAAALTVTCSERAFLAMVRRPPAHGAALPKSIVVIGPHPLLVNLFAAMPLNLLAA